MNRTDAGPVPIDDAPASWLDGPCRRSVHGFLASLTQGSVELQEASELRRLGSASVAPSARLIVHRARFYRRVAIGGSLGAAEAYMDGDWDATDLTGLLTLFARHVDLVDDLESIWTRVAAWAARRLHAARENTLAGSRQNIAAHYDLGNDFFARFLDPTMTYSCAYFESPESTLEQASRAKLRRLCARLDLSPGEHLLEIGTGWGSLALAAAERGCRVTTTTLSREQAAWARERIAAAGFADRVTVLERDYRELTGVYDKLVSVEMIEAVGHEYLPEFFRTCAARLAPHGRMVLQAITLCERHHPTYLASVDFLRRYIFPGGSCPSLSSLSRAIDGSGLGLSALEEIGPHYAPTLAAWRRGFLAARPELAAAGRPERFLRMWEYYLCLCGAGFVARTTGVVQLLLTHGGRVEIVR